MLNRFDIENLINNKTVIYLVFFLLLGKEKCLVVENCLLRKRKWHIFHQISTILVPCRPHVLL